MVLMSRYSTTVLRVMLFCAGKKRISRRFLSVASHSRHCCSSVCTGCMGRKGVKWSVCAVRQRQAGILSLSAGKWKVFPHTTALVLLLYRSIRYDFSPRRHIAGKPKVDTRSPFRRLLFLLSLESWRRVRESPTRLRKHNRQSFPQTPFPSLFCPNSFRCSLRIVFFFAGKQGAD